MCVAGGTCRESRLKSAVQTTSRSSFFQQSLVTSIYRINIIYGFRFPFGYDGRAMVTARPEDGGHVPEASCQRLFEPGLEPPDPMSPEEVANFIARRKILILNCDYD